MIIKTTPPNISATNLYFAPKKHPIFTPSMLINKVVNPTENTVKIKLTFGKIPQETPIAIASILVAKANIRLDLFK